MICYYNITHVLKQFLIRSFVKLSIKYIKFKHHKLSSCWIGPFRILEQIDGQVYCLALSNKYAYLHDVFPIQLLETYCCRDDDKSLMTMPDLEDPWDE